MPTIHFEPNLFTVAFALSVGLFLLRVLLHIMPLPSLPRLHLSRPGFRIALPSLPDFQRVLDDDDEQVSIVRNRMPAKMPQDCVHVDEAVVAPESILEETMRSLNQASTWTVPAPNPRSRAGFIA